MDTAVVDYVLPYADVLPRLEALGERPVALRSYDDNQLRRTRNGLDVTFTFNKALGLAPSNAIIDYCARAFRLAGFDVPAVPAGERGISSFTLHMPAQGLPQTLSYTKKQFDNEIRLVEHQSDAPGPVWVALRTIRQAALLA